jgi:hypothetical protein
VERCALHGRSSGTRAGFGGRRAGALSEQEGDAQERDVDGGGVVAGPVPAANKAAQPGIAVQRLGVESEVEPSSGNVKTEGSSKGFWYPEELDRDIRCS